MITVQEFPTFAKIFIPVEEQNQPRGENPSRPTNQPSRREGDTGQPSKASFSEEKGPDGKRKFSLKGTDGDRRPPRQDRGDKPAWGDRPQRSDRPSYGDRPQKSFGPSAGGDDRRPPRQDRGDKPAWGDRPQRSDRPSYGDKPRFGDKPSFGDKPAWGDRPQRSDRPSYGDKPRFGDKPSFGDKPAWGDRPQRGDRPSYGDKPRFGDKPAWGDRPQRSDRPSYGDKPRFGDKPAWGDRAQKSFGPRAEGDDRRPPSQDSGDKPAWGDRPQRSDRPSYGDKPRFGDKPAWGDRPQRGERGDKDYWDKKHAQRGKPRYKTAEEFAPSTDDMRLNRFLAHAGICSRREADALIADGMVTVNGKIITEMGFKVLPVDDVRYAGERLKSERKVYLLLNKPKGFITTVDDEKARKTVMDLVASACKERIYPVGRLDRGTTGVLMLTNDGALAKKLTHPSHGAKKIYQVTLDKPLTPGDMIALKEGLMLDDGPVQVDKAEFVTADDFYTLGVEIHVGRNRIVRRMFESMGYEVVKLDRTSFAGLTKKRLERGHYRLLNEKEISFLQML